VYAHLMHEYQGIVQEIVKLVLFLIYRTFYIYIYIVENNNRVDSMESCGICTQRADIVMQSHVN
jgi:hypothetical protein